MHCCLRISLQASDDHRFQVRTRIGRERGYEWHARVWLARRPTPRRASRGEPSQSSAGGVTSEWLCGR